VVLAEIDELGDKLSPARAEALLDEFERAIGGALLRQDMAAVMANCEEYAAALPRRSPKKKIEGDLYCDRPLATGGSGCFAKSVRRVSR
jgi:hypothetical protein